MKNIKLFLTIIMAAVLVGAVQAQNEFQPNEAGNPQRPDMRRPNLLAELGLSTEQIQQIRRMNQERRPALAEAQRRMREANRSLDLAIYGDSVTDAEFQSRLKEFQSAQAEIARLRFESELAVRKVLTPEQLVRFRELRRRFAEMRNDRQLRRPGRNMQGPPPGPAAPPKRPLN